jgi:hypothetical protein
MNKALPLVILCLVVGCSQEADPRDARIAELEARVARMEVVMGHTADRTSNLAERVTALLKEEKRFNDELTGLMQAREEHWTYEQAKLLKLVMDMTNSAPRQIPRYATTQPTARTSSSATKDGVPLSVYNQIAAEATKKWGTDYEMQEYEVKKQVEAYRKLHP